MFNVLTILLAATLSLTATNEYRYTLPMTTNLVGKGIGPEGAYLVPRGEDIAFLREAYAERMHALQGTTNYWYDGVMKNGLALQSGWLTLFDWQAYALSAFTPSFEDRWDMRGFSVWGPRAQFVSADFAPESVIVETGPDYLVNGKSTEYTLLAFVGENDAVDKAILYTNSYFVGVPVISRVMGAYSNIVADVSICGLANNDALRTNQVVTTYSLPKKVIAASKIVRSKYEYKLNGETIEAYYTSSVGYESRSATKKTVNVSSTDILDTYYSYRKTTQLPFTTKFNDNYQPTRYHIVQFEQEEEEEYTQKIAGPSGNIRISADALWWSTNYVDEVNAFVVLRAEIRRNETYKGYTSKTGTVCVATNNYVLSTTTTAKREGDSFVVDLDLLNDIQGLFVSGAQWVSAVDYETPDDYDDVKDQPNIISHYVDHIREVRLSALDCYVWFYYHPTFNARVIQ